MNKGSLRTVLRLLERFQDNKAGANLSDAELLQRFLAQRDEAAFEVLVWRHGAAVLNLCHRILRHGHDAEDAFQATFLVLVVKGRSLRKQTSLGSWLYKVAMRVALQARGRAAARAARERHDLEFPADEPEDPVGDRELRQILHEEVNRLPKRYRLPVILCYLSGQSTAEAAVALGCPRGTVLSRLATARQRLLRRLVRRGVVLSAEGLALALAPTAAKASFLLVGTTVKAAVCIAVGKKGAAGVAGSALLLMEGVLQAMLWTKIKTTAATVVLVAALAIGLGFWPRKTATAEARPEPREEQTARTTEEPKQQRPRVEPERPIGVWEHRIEGLLHIVLQFETDRVSLKGTYLAEQEQLTLSGEADYSVTRDSVLFGVITGLDLPGRQEEAIESQLLLDHAFSLRYRVDGDVLTIKDVKFGDYSKQDAGQEAKYLAGRYRRLKDGEKGEPLQDRQKPQRQRGPSSVIGGRYQPVPAQSVPVGPIPMPGPGPRGAPNPVPVPDGSNSGTPLPPGRVYN